jgi:DNA modification methylase
MPGSSAQIGRSQTEGRVILGNCVKVMAAMGESTVDAIVCDPPYELGFMGRAWDSSGVAFRPETWAAALRVLKPGGHLLAFGGTRTVHRIAVAIEDGGFEIRDMVAWMYGSGFPKSHDVSKAIDKAVGAEREVIETIPDRWAGKGDVLQRSTQDAREEAHITAPATDDAKRWNGWGTALKPAHEPIVVARKPLAGTVAANVLEHGTGALNVDGCRLETKGDMPGNTEFGGEIDDARTMEGGERRRLPYDGTTGRWPANVVLDQEAAAQLDAQSGDVGQRGPLTGDEPSSKTDGIFGKFNGRTPAPLRGDSGGASRFFYVAKPDQAERHAGLGDRGDLFAPVDAPERNDHPTVKPIDLMRWLVRLVTPPDGTVLDPFTGSGTTGIATLLEGFSFVGIEREEAYAQIARARLAHWCPGVPAFDRLEAAA